MKRNLVQFTQARTHTRARCRLSRLEAKSRTGLLGLIVLVAAACSGETPNNENASAAEFEVQAAEQALQQAETTDATDETAGEDTPEDEATLSGALGTEEEEPSEKTSLCREGIGQTELSVRWVESGAGKSRTVLQAIVHNHSKDVLEAEPLIMVANSAAGTRTLVLAKMVVQAGQEASVQVPVVDLPLQSSGLASAVTLGLLWKRAGQPQGEVKVPNALSRAFYVRHDASSDFRTAEVRLISEQRVYEAQAGKAAARITELRLRDAATGRMQALSAEEIAEFPTVEVGVEEVEVQP